MEQIVPTATDGFPDLAEEMAWRRARIRERLGLPPAGSEAEGCSGGCSSCGSSCGPQGSPMEMLGESYEVC